MDYQVKFESAVIEVLAKSRIDGNVLFLPEGQLEEWKDEVDDKLGRDYRVLNRVDKQMDRRQDFEHIMLASMKGILSHLAEGNHDDQLRKISRDIDDYLLNRHRSESAGDD
jgi:subtilisin-like proprotein convertase family protein